jgi:RecB family exonuclease
MPGKVFLSPHPIQLFELHKKSKLEHLVITPNPQAAAKLGVPYFSLESLAQNLLLESGNKIANASVARRHFEQAIVQTLAPDDPRGISRTWLPTVQELLRGGIDAEQLRRSSTPQVLDLALVLDAYKRTLRELGLIETSEVLWNAVPLIRKTQNLIVVGYPRLGRAELHFVNMLAGPESTLLLPFASHAIFTGNLLDSQYLAKHSWTVENLDCVPNLVGEKLSRQFWSGNPMPAPLVSEVFDDLDQEVRGVLKSVKRLLGVGESPEDIALVVRDETLYGSTIKRIADEYEVPVRLMYQVPLIKTRIGAWLDVLADVILYGFPYDGTAGLVLHPLANGLSRGIWRQVRQKRPNRFLDWISAGVNLKALNWPREGSRQEFVAKLLEAVAFFDVEAKLPPGGQDALAFERLLSELHEFGDPGQIELGQFLLEFKTTLQEVTTARDTLQDGVMLLTPLTIAGARYRNIFVMGLTEGVFPQALSDSPVLDFAERKAAAEQAWREAIFFWAILEASTDNLHLTYPRQLAQKSQLASPFFSKLGVTPMAAQKLPPISLEEIRHAQLSTQNPTDDAVLNSARHTLFVETKRESREPPDEYDGMIGEAQDPLDFALSPTHLTQFGQCSFRWFANRVMELSEMQELPEELTVTLRGKLYHRVLELVVAQVKDEPDTRQAATDYLNEAFRSGEKDLGLFRIPNWHIQRLEHLEKLLRLLTSDDFLNPKQKVLATEQRFSMQWEGLSVSGVIDRIDQADNGVVVIDYKTSSSVPKGAKNDDGKPRLDVQLPIYMEAVAKQILPNTHVARGIYYSLTKSEDRILATSEPDHSGLTGLANRFKQQLQDGHFPLDPDADGVVCEHCSFDLVCRKGPRLEGKMEANRADS